MWLAYLTREQLLKIGMIIYGHQILFMCLKGLEILRIFGQNGGFYCILGFCGLRVLWVLVGFLGFFLWASWVVSVYTTCVLRGALCFFNKIFLLIK